MRLLIIHFLSSRGLGSLSCFSTVVRVQEIVVLSVENPSELLLPFHFVFSSPRAAAKAVSPLVLKPGVDRNVAWRS